MRWKDIFINVFSNDCGRRYLHNSDILHIQKWSSQDSLRVLEKLIYSCKFLLGSGLCPFCIYHKNDCSKCLYKETHGKCQENNSDYSKIKPYYYHMSIDRKNMIRDDVGKYLEDIKDYLKQYHEINKGYWG